MILKGDILLNKYFYVWYFKYILSDNSAHLIILCLNTNVFTGEGAQWIKTWNKKTWLGTSYPRVETSSLLACFVWVWSSRKWNTLTLSVGWRTYDCQYLDFHFLSFFLHVFLLPLHLIGALLKIHWTELCDKTNTVLSCTVVGMYLYVFSK